MPKNRTTHLNGIVSELGKINPLFKMKEKQFDAKLWIKTRKITWLCGLRVGCVVNEAGVQKEELFRRITNHPFQLLGNFC